MVKLSGLKLKTFVLVSNFRMFVGVIGGVMYIQSSITFTVERGERTG
jgi:hypothetical protein